MQRERGGVVPAHLYEVPVKPLVSPKSNLPPNGTIEKQRRYGTLHGTSLTQSDELSERSVTQEDKVEIGANPYNTHAHNSPKSILKPSVRFDREPELPRLSARHIKEYQTVGKTDVINPLRQQGLLHLQPLSIETQNKPAYSQRYPTQLSNQNSYVDNLVKESKFQPLYVGPGQSDQPNQPSNRYSYSGRKSPENLQQMLNDVMDTSGNYK